MTVDYEEGRRRYWAYDAALDAAVAANSYAAPEIGVAFKAEHHMSSWLLDNRKGLLGIPDDGPNLFGEQVGPESAIDQIQRALYAGIHAIRDKQGKVDKSDPTVISMEVAAARFGELRALLNPDPWRPISEATSDMPDNVKYVLAHKDDPEWICLADGPPEDGEWYSDGWLVEPTHFRELKGPGHV